MLVTGSFGRPLQLIFILAFSLLPLVTRGSSEQLAIRAFGKSISNAIVHQIVGKVRSYRIAGSSSRGGLVPPILIPFLPDIPIEDGRIDFNNSLTLGFYDYRESQLELLEGLKILWDNLMVSDEENQLTIAYSIGFKDLTIHGKYTVDIAVNMTHMMELFPDLPIEDFNVPVFIAPLTGAGEYDLGLTNISLGVTLTVYTEQGKIENVTTGLVIHLDRTKIYFENLIFNGNDGIRFEKLWPWLNCELTESLMQLVRTVAGNLGEILDVVLTMVLKGCLLEDIQNGDFSCTGLIPTTPPPVPGPISSSTTELRHQSSTTDKELPTLPTTESEVPGTSTTDSACTSPSAASRVTLRMCMDGAMLLSIALCILQ